MPKFSINNQNVDWRSIGSHFLTHVPENTPLLTIEVAKEEVGMIAKLEKMVGLPILDSGFCEKALADCNSTFNPASYILRQLISQEGVPTSINYKWVVSGIVDVRASSEKLIIVAAVRPCLAG